MVDASTAGLLVVLAGVAGLFMAWAIGANDVANAMGTSVGSGALKHNQAVILAGILEFCGAFLVGAHVTETIRSKIIEPTDFAQLDLMLGMVAALLGAGLWLLIASALGRPVSTTHSIVGAIAGFGLLLGGVDAVRWQKIGEIAASWVISPLLSGCIAYLVFQSIERLVLQAHDPARAVKRWAPVYAFAVFAIMTLVTIFKGLKNLHLHLDFNQSAMIAGLVGIAAASVCGWLVGRARIDADGSEVPPLALERGLHDLRRRATVLREAATGPLRERLGAVEGELTSIESEVAVAAVPSRLRPELRFVERVFGLLQILSACFVAFAHGSNDVANAVGPVAAVLALAGNTVTAAGEASVPSGVLLLGAGGIVLGLATFGRRVMATIGRKITELTPSRGFAAEFSAATTIVLASRLGLPVSTTHTLVGGVLGVGLARGIASLDPKVVRDIVIAWLIEIPAAALLTVVSFWLLRLLIG